MFSCLLSYKFAKKKFSDCSMKACSLGGPKPLPSSPNPLRGAPSTAERPYKLRLRLNTRTPTGDSPQKASEETM